MEIDNGLQYLTTLEQIFHAKNKVKVQSENTTTLLNLNSHLNYKNLHEAAIEGDLDYIKNKAKFGCNLDVRDEDGDTPLMYAASSGQYKICKFLIESGCNEHAINYYGFSAYHMADDNGHYDICELIGWTWFS